MPTSSFLVASQVVILTTSTATSDNKVGIMTTLGFYIWQLILSPTKIPKENS